MSSPLAVSDLDFPLPPGAIATTPAEPRESAKLMVVARATGEIVSHETVRELPRFIRKGDLLIVNNTRVLQARLEGARADTGGAVEGLYLQPAQGSEARQWLCLLSAKRLKEGVSVELRTRDGQLAPLRLQLIRRMEEKAGAWLVTVVASGAEGQALLAQPDEVLLESIGHTPLPPYIRTARKRANHEVEVQADRERYQTVYAKSPAQGQQLGEASDKVGLLHTGSVAAPTAGLHLTPAVLAELAQQGATVREVVLHVGLGTFAPVEVQFLEQHPMHEERCSMSQATRDAVLATRAAGGRVICVGTTSVRTVESYAPLWSEDTSPSWPGFVDTKLLMSPSYATRWTDGLLTNFHTPRSTLLALVSTMLGDRGELQSDPLGGLAKLKELYAIALEKQYRFFSYGDAMLIV